MRTLSGLLLGLVVAAVAAAAVDARSAAGGFRIAVTNWYTCATCTTMRGVVSGDVVGTVGGGLIGFRRAATGATFQTLHSRYVVRAARGARSFVALVNGRQNLKTGAVVLDGLVTDGWETGAQVHVELRRVACSQSAGGCFTGTIRVQ